MATDNRNHIGKVLVFGVTGFLGQAVKAELESTGHLVVGVTRGEDFANTVSMADASWMQDLAYFGQFSGIVWAQGANSSGSVLDETSESLHSVFEANVVFITETMRLLIESDLLAKPARSVVLSSVWQRSARSNKLGYLLAKSAIAGLVPSLALDLAEKQVAVNAVLPGVISSPMARANLSSDQIGAFERDSIGGILATAAEVAKVTAWLLSPESSGLNAQSLVVDHGWSNIRNV